MKTAEEWAATLPVSSVVNSLDRVAVTVAQIKSIQLDAFKAGMTKAAGIASDTVATGRSSVKWEIKNAILTARDNKTNL